MNPVFTMEELGIGKCDSPESAVLAFLASRSRQPGRQLAAPAVEVFKGIRETIDQLMLAILETRNKAEYQQVFTKVYPKFAGITLTLAGFAGAVVQQDVINRMARESLCEMEADLRDKGLPAFGADVKQQAMFTIWTLRKISDLAIQAAGAKPSNQQVDAEYLTHFTNSILWAKFSLDCLLMALRSNHPVYPEVREELIEGMRSMVNAYAWARKGLELRVPETEQPIVVHPLDDEDHDLLEASMQNAAELEL